VSQENVQVLREGLAAINSGEIERILAFVHPDFVAIVPEELSAEVDRYKDRAAVACRGPIRRG
jgi:ketosteroid isomerase-like protein